MEVWLDLEQTVIALWQEPELCNVQEIRHFLQTHNICNVNIFSFAVWHADDKMMFNTYMRPRLVEALGVDIYKVPTVEDMMQVIFHKQGTFTRNEFTNVWGKSKAFHDYIYLSGMEGHHVLIDDMVKNCTVKYENEPYVIRYIDVNTLEKS